MNDYKELTYELPACNGEGECRVVLNTFSYLKSDNDKYAKYFNTIC